MATQATSTLTVQSWDEETLTELDGGRKLSHARVGQAASGDIEGEASVEWLMCYRPDQTAEFVGMQRMDGSLGGRSGSFVLRSVGTFDGKEARGELSVVQGSGTGELSELRGTGEFSAPLGSEAHLRLDYELG